MGFTQYAELARMVCPLDALAPAKPVPGVVIEPYRNDWAAEFAAAEQDALAGVPKFVEIGQPSGYEQAAGFDCFLVARRGARIVGFAQAQLPEGWVNWMGVVADERRHGIGRDLIAQVARAVRAGRGTHIGAEVDVAGAGPAFWSRLGGRERARLRCLIHRGEPA